jgi:hypothetical protein
MPVWNDVLETFWGGTGKREKREARDRVCSGYQLGGGRKKFRGPYLSEPRDVHILTIGRAYAKDTHQTCCFHRFFNLYAIITQWINYL